MYAGEVLGLSSEVSSRIFDAIHKTAKSASQAKSVFTKDDEIITMLESLGADKAKAEKTLNSFAVQSLVKRADSRTRSFAVKGTPELVIDGRYRVTSSHAKSYAEMLAIATFLSKKVAKERGIVK